MPVSPNENYWHTIETSAVIKKLETFETGLDQLEALARLNKWGPNSLPQKTPPQLWQIILSQFRSPLIFILILAGFISLSMGEFKDAVFIAIVLSLNALLGSYQEWQAEKNCCALRNLLKIKAFAERNSQISEVNAEDLVPGDIVWLETGNRVPADMRLLKEYSLEIDESLLTGESVAIPKNANWLGTETTLPADHLNMAYAGSIVTRGRGKGVVVATGPRTTVGNLASDLTNNSKGKPPLVLRMEKFVRFIAISVLIAIALIGASGVILSGHSAKEMFFFSIALAVSAIPEGLPVAMTIALSVATTRMSRKGLIVRHLTAVEGLGSCSMIATDKTGTLTCNELTVKEIFLNTGKIFQVTGSGYAPNGEILSGGIRIQKDQDPNLVRLIRAGVLCNEATLNKRDETWTWRGDPVDIAILATGNKIGLDRDSLLRDYPMVDQIPFEPDNQYASTIHKTGNGYACFFKGSPEKIISMCWEQFQPEILEKLQNEASRLAGQGFKVLAFADQITNTATILPEDNLKTTRLNFLGLMGMIDPIRPGVKEAIQKCQEAGVRIVMITGDHRITALAIARELGIAKHAFQVATGPELTQVSPFNFPNIIKTINVFARVTPRQKLEIVNTAREVGHYVAVTGDGVNDASALRSANIGIAMGKSGTDVAREASDLVISDDNFSTIVVGIEEGRVAYANIRKVIFLLVSSGAVEVVIMGLAIFTGTPFLPLLPAQILWLNLVTNGIQDVALAFEPSEGNVLKQKPISPLKGIFDQLMIERTIITGLSMGFISYVTFRWLLPAEPNDAEIQAARNNLLLLLVLFENIHLGNCRSETKSFFKLSPFRSPILLVSALMAFALHVSAMYLPMGKTFLGVEPISFENWLTLIFLALIILPVIEFHKWTWNLRNPLFN